MILDDLPFPRGQGPLADVQVCHLLGRKKALLFPIQWDEPFGLVMIEAMACGTPVLALPGGSVAEIVKNGAGGFVCGSLKELQEQARNIETSISASTVRRYAEQHFSLRRMTLEYERLYLENLGQKPLADLGELMEMGEEQSAA